MFMSGFGTIMVYVCVNLTRIMWGIIRFADKVNIMLNAITAKSYRFGSVLPITLIKIDIFSWFILQTHWFISVSKARMKITLILAYTVLNARWLRCIIACAFRLIRHLMKFIKQLFYSRPFERSGNYIFKIIDMSKLNHLYKHSPPRNWSVESEYLY